MKLPSYRSHAWRLGAALLGLGLAVLPVTRLAAAELGAVKGRVSDAQRDVYLNNARVRIGDTSLETFTNEAGEYQISGVAPGTVTVHVFYTGLESRSADALVSAGKTTNVDFRLERPASPEEPLLLPEMVVAAQRETTARAIAINEQRFTPNVKTVVAADEFGEAPDGSVGQFLKFLPGVVADYTGNDVSSVTVRGLPASSTLFTVDGNRMASPTADSMSRSFSPSRVSLNNVARIEVVKTPTPDLPANAIGGSVNLVNKSAFEYRKPSFSYQASVNANSNALTTARTAGPDRDGSRKLGPGFNFTYVRPVSDRFGFTLTGLYSDRFTPEYRRSLNWIPPAANNPFSTAAVPVTVDNPLLRGFGLLENPQTQRSVSVGGTLDVKVSPRDVVNVGFQWGYNEVFSGTYSATFDMSGTGGVPVNHGPDFSESANGAGQVLFNSAFADKIGKTTHLSVKYRHTGEVWKFDAAGFYSDAVDRTRDIDRGFFKDAQVRLRGKLRYDGIGSDGPASITMTDTLGGTDWRALDDYTLVNANSVPIDSTHGIKGGDVNLTRELGAAVPVTIKTGASVTREDRDLRKPARQWTFVGPNGTANNSDDLARNYDVVSSQAGLDRAGSYGPVQHPSPYKLYDLYRAHPEYWTVTDADDAFAVTQNANNSLAIQETIAAGYLRGDARLFGNRLRLVGGARYERTSDRGAGPRNDITATYVRDANGNLTRTKKPGTAADLRRLQYTERGAHTQRDYDGIYPSANVAFQITDQLVARFGYARTIARPNLDQIVPGVTIGEATAATPLITVRNPDLKPWSADNYDLSLEYYFEPAGVLSAGVFRKDISDFFGQVTTPATTDLLGKYGLDETYLPYTFSFKDNVGAARVDGLEVNYTQGLTFLPNWARGVTVFANFTSLRLQGTATADFSSFVRRSINWGVSLSRPKYTVKLNWNYRGQQRGSLITGGNVPAGTYQYFAPRLLLDLSAEYRISPRYALFVTARNVTNDDRILDVYGASTPAYARRSFTQQFGAQYYAGIKGRF